MASHIHTVSHDYKSDWKHHDDVINWKHFPRYWPFVRGIHRSPVNSPHKGQWRGALMSLICALNKRLSKHLEAGDLRPQRTNHDVIVMENCYPMSCSTSQSSSIVFPLKVNRTKNKPHLQTTEIVHAYSKGNTYVPRYGSSERLTHHWSVLVPHEAPIMPSSHHRILDILVWFWEHMFRYCWS